MAAGIVAAGATGQVVNQVVVTGGPALAWLVAALACLLAGGVVPARSRRE